MLRAGERGERGPVRFTEPAGLLLSRARGAVAGLGVPARWPEELRLRARYYCRPRKGRWILLWQHFELKRVF